MIQILHNPRCGKSRECLAFLQKTATPFEIINYLVNVPTVPELILIIKKLGVKPIDVIRIKEKIWIEKYKNKKFSDSELIQIMVENPILIERPIAINGKNAVIARPLEKIEEIL